jgi:hypothetical protein
VTGMDEIGQLAPLRWPYSFLAWCSALFNA